MAQVYDIMSRLTNDKPVIKIAEGKEYKVSNSKNSAIFIKQLSQDPKLDDFERMDMIVEAALGKEALEYINTLELSINNYSVIITAIMAAISDQSLEEMENLQTQELKKVKKK